MKQKILFLCFSIMVTAMFSKAYAATIEVRSLEEFSTANPPASISVELLEPLEINENQTIKAGVVVTGKLVDVKKPKRLKRDATFSFKPVSYTDENGVRHAISTNIKGKLSEPLDTVELAKDAALGVGNFFVKGIKTTAAVVEGTVKNEQGNRLKSAGYSLYESTPVSYVEQGEDIKIKKNDSFYLKFPRTKDEYSTKIIQKRSNIK